jgi:hypothetical protein
MYTHPFVRTAFKTGLSNSTTLCFLWGRIWLFIIRWIKLSLETVTKLHKLQGARRNQDNNLSIVPFLWNVSRIIYTAYSLRRFIFQIDVTVKWATVWTIKLGVLLGCRFAKATCISFKAYGSVPHGILSVTVLRAVLSCSETCDSAWRSFSYVLQQDFPQVK